MRVREAFRQYAEYAPDLKRRTLQRMEHDLNRWVKLVGDSELSDIGPEVFARFRQSCNGLSARTIEGNISTVLTLCRHSHSFGQLAAIPGRGRSLRVKRSQPKQPSLDDVQKLYAFAHVTLWPRRLFVTPTIFWRAWIVLIWGTALRLGDMLRLEWSMIDPDAGVIRIEAEKTGKVHEIPIHPVAWAHLAMLKGPTDRVFPARKSHKQLLREMHRMSGAAGIEPVTSQQLRRFSATEWERAAHGAGQYIQGSTLRNSSSFYIDTTEILRSAMENLRVPSAFTDGVEIAQEIAEKKREERIKLKSHQFELPKLPDVRQWAFAPGCFCFCGQWYKLRGVSWRVLKCLVEAGEAVDGATLAQVIYEHDIPTDAETVSGRVGTVLSILRGKLRDAFGLEKSFDPIPCVSIERLNGGGHWTVFLPSTDGRASA